MRDLDATKPSVTIYLRGPFLKWKEDRSKYQEPNDFIPNLLIPRDMSLGMALNVSGSLLHKVLNKGISQVTFHYNIL